MTRSSSVLRLDVATTQCLPHRIKERLVTGSSPYGTTVGKRHHLPVKSYSTAIRQRICVHAATNLISLQPGSAAHTPQRLAPSIFVGLVHDVSHSYRIPLRLDYNRGLPFVSRDVTMSIITIYYVESRSGIDGKPSIELD